MRKTSKTTSALPDAESMDRMICENAIASSAFEGVSPRVLNACAKKHHLARIAASKKRASGS